MKKIFLTQIALSMLFIVTSCEDGNRPSTGYRSQSAGADAVVETALPLPITNTDNHQKNATDIIHNINEEKKSDQSVNTTATPSEEKGVAATTSTTPKKPDVTKPTTTKSPTLSQQPAKTSSPLQQTGQNGPDTTGAKTKPQPVSQQASTSPPVMGKKDELTNPTSEEKEANNQKNILKAILTSKTLIKNQMKENLSDEEKEAILKDIFNKSSEKMIQNCDNEKPEILYNDFIKAVATELSKVNNISEEDISNTPVFKDVSVKLAKDFGCLSAEEYEKWLLSTAIAYNKALKKKTYTEDDIDRATQEVAIHVMTEKKGMKQTSNETLPSTSNEVSTNRDNVTVANGTSAGSYTIGELRKSGSDGATNDASLEAAKAIIPGLAILALGTVAAIAVIDP